MHLHSVFPITIVAMFAASAAPLGCAKIIFILLLMIVLLLRFTIYYNQSSYVLPPPLIKEGLPDLESMRSKCERCLIAYRNDQGGDNSSGIIRSSVINVACPECRERVLLSECDGDIFMTVKTTLKFHNFRLSLLLFTWMQTVDPDQLFVVTDTEDYWINEVRKSGINTVKTNCPEGHCRSCLCCKSGYEFDQYYQAINSGKKYRWFCHFDDDEYINTKILSSFLKRYNFTKEYYFGRGRQMSLQRVTNLTHPKSLKNFSYALGAAYCLSAALMKKMEIYFRGENFVTTCNNLSLPDDAAVGAVVEVVLGVKLTGVKSILIQYSKYGRIRPDKLQTMMTISMKCPNGYCSNTVKMSKPTFNEREDPTRILSYHCLLYPTSTWCGKQSVS